MSQGRTTHLADIASRAITHIDDDFAFLTHFDTLFPLQGRYWQRASPPPELLSNVILTLRGQRLTLQRWMVPSGPPIGAGGPSTAPNVELIHGCGTSALRPAASYCWALPPGLELDSLGKAGRLAPNLSKKPCVTWHKPSCWKDTPTPAEQQQATTWLCPLPTSLSPTATETLHRDLKCALPVHAIDLAASARNDMAAAPRERATAHLIVLAFYFLLRVGEYTLPRTPHDENCPISTLRHPVLARPNAAPFE
jgi:hypothetical protein